MTLLARIVVTPRPVLNDPQGRAVQRGLQTLGFDEAADVRVGKYLEITLDLASRTRAQDRVRDMCDRLLANQVIEDYRYEIVDADSPAESSLLPGTPRPALGPAPAPAPADS
ncbi:MAG: phosphoribosylformylglycinamidine synthase subunit PurS, partial [Candidatus Dormiibacterota bacterium]